MPLTIMAGGSFILRLFFYKEMHKFLFYSGAWSRQDVPMCNFLLLESDLVPRQLDCDCEQNAKPGQLGTEKD